MRLLSALLAALVVTGCGASPSEPEPQPSSSAAPVTTSKPREFTVVATGDVLIHPELTEQAEADASGDAERDFRPMFHGVRPLVASADLALCHLEVPLSGPDGPFSGYPSFNAPPEVADALSSTGYDACSTASNHTLDQGVDGLTSTLDRLDEAGIEHTGSYRTQAESAEPLLLDAGPARVGHVSLTYGFNGIELPEPWMADVLSVDNAVRKAAAARKAGADVVIVSAHWGTEHQHEPTSEQQAMAKELLSDDNIDVVVGHHAHAVQPVENLDGKWVAYGLGNHVARHADPIGTTEDGLAVRFTFRKGPDGWRVRRAEYVPTFVALEPQIRLLDLTVDGMAEDYPEPLARIDEVVLSRGADADGLTRPGAG